MSGPAARTVIASPRATQRRAPHPRPGPLPPVLARCLVSRAIIGSLFLLADRGAVLAAPTDPADATTESNQKLTKRECRPHRRPMTRPSPRPAPPGTVRVRG